MKHTAHLLLIVSAIALAACGKKDDADKTPEPTPEPAKPEPTPPEPAAKSPVDHYLDYVAAFNERDEKRLAEAFSPDAVLTLADNPEPMTGAEAIVASNVSFWTAMPDTKLEPQVVMAAGNKVAALLLGHGTHTGPMTTPAGTMPPSGAETGSYGIEIVELDAKGTIVSGTQFWDVGLLFGQISKDPNARKPLREGAGKPVVATANHGTSHPLAEAFKAWTDAYNQKDFESATVAYTDKSVVSYTAMADDMTGAKAVRDFFEKQRKGFPDIQGEVTQVWGAGDYLLAVVTYTGTNTGKLPPRIKKPTGKKLTLQVASIFQLDPANKQIVNHWVVSNGMAVMGQLGLMPTNPPKLQKKK